MTTRPKKKSTKSSPIKKLYVVTNCLHCPNAVSERTPGAGYALDYFCKAADKKIIGYVEYPSEEPDDGVFPKWCPLKDAK